jgi:hypothetical protein
LDDEYFGEKRKEKKTIQKHARNYLSTVQNEVIIMRDNFGLLDSSAALNQTTLGYCSDKSQCNIRRRTDFKKLKSGIKRMYGNCIRIVNEKDITPELSFVSAYRQLVGNHASKNYHVYENNLNDEENMIKSLKTMCLIEDDKNKDNHFEIFLCCLP